MTPDSTTAPARSALSPSMLLLVLVLTVVWGCNWPVMKMAVSELPPLAFRSSTLVCAALGMLMLARLSGHSVRIPRGCWGKVIVLALFNIALWNGMIVFGVQQLPAGRSAILAYTMPVWTVIFSAFALNEPLSMRRIGGLVLGMAGMALLIGEDVRYLQRSPTGTLLIIAAAMAWAVGTVLLRKWNVPIPQNALSGWMMLLGWVPLVILAPLLAPWPDWHSISGTAWFAILYNIVFSGTIAHWAWFNLARKLPAAVSSMSSLPVPVVGVFSGMVLLGERPGSGDWAALGLVMAAMIAVLWTPRPPPAPLAPDE